MFESWKLIGKLLLVCWNAVISPKWLHMPGVILLEIHSGYTQGLGICYIHYLTAFILMYTPIYSMVRLDKAQKIFLFPVTWPNHGKTAKIPDPKSFMELLSQNQSQTVGLLKKSYRPTIKISLSYWKQQYINLLTGIPIWDWEQLHVFAWYITKWNMHTYCAFEIL